jgi:hypothetical protein
MVNHETPAAAELITSDEVIERLLAEPSLRRKALTCVLGAVRHGNEWRFRRSDLETWIARHSPVCLKNLPRPS